MVVVVVVGPIDLGSRTLRGPGDPKQKKTRLRRRRENSVEPWIFDKRKPHERALERGLKGGLVLENTKQLLVLPTHQ